MFMLANTLMPTKALAVILIFQLYRVYLQLVTETNAFVKSNQKTMKTSMLRLISPLISNTNMLDSKNNTLMILRFKLERIGFSPSDEF